MPYETLKGAFTRFAAAVRRTPAPARPVQSRPWRLDTTEWSLELLRRLEWRRLEELCVAYFEALGWTTRVSDPGTGSGADIVLHPPEGADTTTLARCRAWNAFGIGVKHVLALQAALAASGAGKGLILSAGKFTQEARTFADAQGIELLDGAAFVERIGALPPEKSLALLRFATEGDFLTPTCPDCAIKMVSKQSTQGGRRFWGCTNYPRCKQLSYATANAPA